MSRPRILLADDHFMVAEGIRGLLGDEFECLGIVEDGRALVEEARKQLPDVIVADIAMPHLNGIDALVQLKQDIPKVKVVFLTMHREMAFARRALEAGASGYLLKHSEGAEVVLAIRAVLKGQRYISPAIAGDVVDSIRSYPETTDPLKSLTPRQREILQQFVEGKSAKEIAAILDISTRTVEFHKYQMMQSVGLQNSAELICFAIKNGLVDI